MPEQGAKILEWAKAVAIATVVMVGALVLALSATLALEGKLGSDPADDPWLISSGVARTVLAVAIVVIGVLAFLAWHARFCPGAGTSPRRVLSAAAFGLLSGVGAAAIAIVLAFVFTGVLDRPGSAEPESLTGATIALFVLLLLAAGSVLGMITLWWRRVEGGKLPLLAYVPVVALVGAILLRTLLAAQPAVHDPAADERRAAIETRLFPRHAVIVLVDPRDAITRRLTALAQDQPQAFTGQRDGIVRSGMTTGIAVPSDAAEDVQVVQPPTDRRTVLLATLAERLPAEGLGGPDSKSAALGALLAQGSGWPDGARRHVAVLFDRLPERPRAWTESVPRGEALKLHVVATDGSPAARIRWLRWAEGGAGSVSLPDRYPDDRHPIDVAQDAAVDRADAEELGLASRFRPYLKFDSADGYRPLDVDAYLAELGSDALPDHQLCRRATLAADPCTELRGAGDIHAGFDHVKALGGSGTDTATEPDDGRPAPTTERIYYHRTGPDESGRLHLDYWWFFRFNSSPVAADVMCLRGLSISEATCFDHEGDWEGATVTLRQVSRPHGIGWTAESVTYAGHAWRFRYLWPDLIDVGSVADDTHPVVHVARGSHASYPVRCWTQRLQARGGCSQPGLTRPDGRRNGLDAWSGNTDCRGCVLELPVDDHGAPTRWNAFGGRWGAAACTVGLKLCVRADGPLSPSYQVKRYAHPGSAPNGDRKGLFARAGVRLGG